MNPVLIRSAIEGDIAQVARLWFDGWQDAHAEVLPDELRRLRTLKSFQERLAVELRTVLVAEAHREIVGFALVKGDELNQFYVARAARGTPVAPVLMQAAFEALRASGSDIAWLACAIGNDRAARFYEKSGWRRVGTVTSYLPTPTGDLALDVWRFEFTLRAAGR